MPLPSFTLAEDVTLYDILGDVSGGELSPAVLTQAEVKFKSNVPEDRFVTWESNLYRVPAVTAKVTAEGILRADGGGPVTLLANDPGLSVEDLQWFVEVRIPDLKEDTGRYSGVTRMRSMRKWIFNAPLDGAVVNLATTVPVPGMDVAAAPPALTVAHITDAGPTGRSVLAAGTPAAARTVLDVPSFTEMTSAIDDLIDGAPGTRDTLKEISDALTADEGALSALTSTVAGKLALGPDYVQVVCDTTGSVDASAAVSAAITALPAAGGTVELPSGTLKWSNALSVTKANIRIVGRGQSKTVIVPDSGVGTNEVIRFTSAAPNARVELLSITATASANSAVLRFGGADSRVERVEITGSAGSVGGAQRGIVGDSTATGFEAVRCRVSGITTDTSTYGHGAGISVSGSDSTLDRCVVSGCTGSANAAYYHQMGGILLQGVSGISGQNIKVLKCDSFSNGVHGLYATGCDHLLIDGGVYRDNGALASASGGTGVAGTNFGRGISIGSAASISPKIVNTVLRNNQENGMIVSIGGAGTEVSLVQDAIVANNHAHDNNLGGFAGGHGIEVNARGGTITGNVCYNNHNGISISGVYLTITGNRCYSNTSTDSTQGAGIHLNFIAGTTSLSVTTTSGSNSVTVASGGFPGVIVGAAISGTGIPASTYVTAISGNTLKMSANATASATVTATFTGNWTNNVITGNFLAFNDNFGVRVVGDTQQGTLVSDNIFSYNGIAERASANYDISAASTVRNMTVRNNQMMSGTVRINLPEQSHNRGGNMTVSDNGRFRNLSYGATVSWNGESSEIANLTVTDTNAFTISAPSVAFNGREVTFYIRNSSGGAMGTITWGAGLNLAGAFTNPANGKARTITFKHNGAAFYEISRSAADI